MILLEKVYFCSYIKVVVEIVDYGGGFLDIDILVFVKSYDVVLLVVSVWLDGVDLVLINRKFIFVLVRLFGYYVESRWGMGFCLFFNVAIAVYYVLEKLDINKVVIFDWDVYYGNGI